MPIKRRVFFPSFDKTVYRVRVDALVGSSLEEREQYWVIVEYENRGGKDNVYLSAFKTGDYQEFVIGHTYLTKPDPWVPTLKELEKMAETTLKAFLNGDAR